MANISTVKLTDNVKRGIRAVAIPFGELNASSTSSAMSATVDGIFELVDGVCCYIKNGRVTSANSFTLEINGLGAKPVYSTLASASRPAVPFKQEYTMLFVYNSSRITGGCWDMYLGIDTTDATSAYVTDTTLYITTGINNGDEVSY